MRRNHMIRTFDELIQSARKRGGIRIAIAGAESSTVMEAASKALEYQIMKPVLVGNQDAIETLRQRMGLRSDAMEIIHAETDEEAALKAVGLVHSGGAKGVMKGKVSTPVMLKAVLDKRFELKGSPLLSHAALIEIKTYSKLIMVTDGGMVIRPDREQKVEILKNGIGLMRKLGIVRPKVALLAAIENVNPDMPETVDADAIVRMANAGAFGEVDIEGPIAVDVAFSPESAKMKGVQSAITGQPDILLMPGIACGNIFAKGLQYLAGARVGGLVLGAKCPIILLSRSDDAETKLNSIALGIVASYA